VCFPNPCENDGTCIDLSYNFSCECVPGYTDKKCSINIDDCDPDPCEKGQNCIDLVDGFTCDCVNCARDGN
jgi:Notch-like protein